MNTVNCCYNCKYHIEGECNDSEQCGYCHKGEVFCIHGKKTEVNPNNICDFWEKEEWVLP
jgi:hypothetical protein